MRGLQDRRADLLVAAAANVGLERTRRRRVRRHRRVPRLAVDVVAVGARDFVLHVLARFPEREVTAAGVAGHAHRVLLCRRRLALAERIRRPVLHRFLDVVAGVAVAGLAHRPGGVVLGPVRGEHDRCVLLLVAVRAYRRLTRLGERGCGEECREHRQHPGRGEEGFESHLVPFRSSVCVPARASRACRTAVAAGGPPSSLIEPVRRWRGSARTPSRLPMCTGSYMPVRRSASAPTASLAARLVLWFSATCATEGSEAWPTDRRSAVQVLFESRCGVNETSCDIASHGRKKQHHHGRKTTRGRTACLDLHQAAGGQIGARRNL